MRTDGEIRDKTQEIMLGEFNRRIQEATVRLPHLCQHNYRHPLDTRQLVEGEANPGYNRINQVHLPLIQTIGLCMLEENNLMICEDPIDAKKCPLFVPVATKQIIYETFIKQLGDTDWVKANMPELYSLLWVLEEFSTVSIPWWKKLWFKLAKIKIEPITPYRDPAHLLPPSET